MYFNNQSLSPLLSSFSGQQITNVLPLYKIGDLNLTTLLMVLELKNSYISLNL